MDDVKNMKLALQQATEAYREGEVPIGAVIVGPNGEIVAKSHNMTQALHDPTAHAEMLALTSAFEALGGKYLQDCTLYVTLEPCPMCAGALAHSRVGKIVYASKDPKGGASRFTPSMYHPKTEVVQGVLEEDCLGLLKKFFEEKR